MRVNIYLLVLVLGYKAAAGKIHEIVEEKTQVTLRCPHSVEGDVTWSRERNGDKTDILTVSGGRNIKHIHDPGRRYGSSADKSLHIVKPVVSDSGRYFCNNEAAADLTVIPSGTTIVIAQERTSITLTCPHDVGASHVPTWTRDSGGIQPRRFDVSPVDQTLTITDVQPGDSGLYYCDGKPAVSLNVIEGNTAPRTTTTTTTRTNPTTPTTTTTTTPKTATATFPPTEARVTTVPSTPPRTDKDTTTTKKQRDNKKKAQVTVPSTPPGTDKDTTTTKKQRNNKRKGKKTTTTRTNPTTPTTTTGNTTSTNAVPQPLRSWVIGVVVSFVLLLFLIIVNFTRRRFKRQGSEERSPVYEEIQEGFLLQTTNGSEERSPIYDEIQNGFVPRPTNVTSLPNESPYSLIGNNYNNKGLSQQIDNTYCLLNNTYCLLEKPKATANNQNQ
ncbi:mucin-5AC-like [Perca flavescens]|uniref:mucin-5AC-like n=1 Tax=Perca flavescens TaxID=8167 RepID=UPI00106E7140|nr:mucin-5AC-like [Perca flavescens]